MEFRAHVDALEAYDWAADQNFARHEGKTFDSGVLSVGRADRGGGPSKSMTTVFSRRAAISPGTASGIARRSPA